MMGMQPPPQSRLFYVGINVSVPPPVILKLMLLLVFYNVRSERELMDTLPERIDWLWFLDYDLDSNITTLKKTSITVLREMCLS